ncbi:hypothetical protein RRG08_054340 [Elysia crispata]|uniref:S1 motif domain-containing protein n=1 Tax=Elysia crispata TaxID=231223 RepID=A0AAE1EAT9_9GAST|nr:hypothetical protein RRG08_054340 [Elysia crispata]
MAKDQKVQASWEPETLIADRLNLRRKSVHNVISLLDEGATIPFIARYRKEQTDDMGPDMLREVAAGLEELRSVEAKIQTVHNAITKMGKMTNVLDTSLRFSTSLLEVDSVYAPFKPGHKGTHAERARALGLEAPALKILNGQSFGLESFINPSKKGLECAGDVEKGIKHVVADIVSKDKEVTDKARSICESCGVLMESSQAKAKNSQDKKRMEGDTKTKGSVTEYKAQKFEQYFNFKMPVKSLKSYQVLALNRGEDMKVLNIKVAIPDRGKAMLIHFAANKYLKNIQNQYQNSLIRQAIEDAYDRLIEPALCRKIRSDLTSNAEKASITVFNSNLKNLLLVSPVKYKTILGIDPGFKNGCKVAVISPTGQVMNTDVLYLHDFKSNKITERKKMVSIVTKYRCDIIAIGNGTACRETESIVADLLKQGLFKPLPVVYSIVDECGASIYSVSDQAKKEFPDLDPTLRGAVSIARRLQDPLAELVKIEPKHLGVGMYQHDINKTKLETALSSVVEECVSFVGVDINTGSECLLRRVAGLNAAKAKHIVEWRLKNGYFTSRQQLLSIKGLGKKGFEQCAGFIRVTNHTSGDSASETVQKTSSPVKDEKKGRKRKLEGNGPKRAKQRKGEMLNVWNPLDSTAVHPESYDIAHRLMEHLGADPSDIGQEHFISLFKRKSTEPNLKKFCDEQDFGFATVKFISDALKQPLSYDLREGSQKPLFKQDIVSASDLKSGSELTGRVLNVTHFGAFVDIGVNINGLIHKSKMGRFGKLAVGDRVGVKVESINLDRQRIGLILQSVNETS